MVCIHKYIHLHLALLHLGVWLPLYPYKIPPIHDLEIVSHPDRPHLDQVVCLIVRAP